MSAASASNSRLPGGAECVYCLYKLRTQKMGYDGDGHVYTLQLPGEITWTENAILQNHRFTKVGHMT